MPRVLLSMFNNLNFKLNFKLTAQFPLILRRGVLAIMMIAMTFATTDTSRGSTASASLAS